MDQTPEQTQQLRDAFMYAQSQYAQQKTHEQVKADLLNRGYDDYTADQIATKAQLTNQPAPMAPQAPAQPRSSDGTGNMILGAIICAVGIIVTVGSYKAAQGGGSYVVAWGAIVFGAIRFFRGLAQRS